MDLPSYISQDLHNIATKKRITAKSLVPYDDITLARAAYYFTKHDNTLLQRAVLRFRGLSPLPLIDGAELFKHQLGILKFMKTRETTLHPFGVRGGLILAEMGLGKTLASISYGCMYRGKTPTLVVCPKSLLKEWETNGFAKFFDVPYLRVGYMYKGYPVPNVEECDFIITTYDVCLTLNKKGDGPYSTLFSTEWNRVVCDESQRFGNPKRKTYAAVTRLQGKSMFCLTGTVIRNLPTDILSQLRFCGLVCDVSETEWNRNVVKYMASYKLREVMMSMSYEDAGVVIPKKHTHIHNIPLTGKHFELYSKLQSITESAYERFEVGKCSVGCVLASFTRQRQATIAPYLLCEESKRKPSTKESPEMDSLMSSPLGKWIRNRDGDAGIGAPKIRAILDILRNTPQGEKTVVFSMFNSALSLIAYALEKNNIKYVQIDGSTSADDRVKLLNVFKNGDVDVLLLNYKVGSEGINISEGNRVIRVEEWWSSAIHKQADARCHRIGQLKEVHVNVIRTVGTIEEKIAEVCRVKSDVADRILGEKLSTKVLNSVLTKDIMRSLIVPVKKDIEEEYW